MLLPSYNGSECIHFGYPRVIYLGRGDQRLSEHRHRIEALEIKLGMAHEPTKSEEDMTVDKLSMDVRFVLPLFLGPSISYPFTAPNHGRNHPNLQVRHLPKTLRPSRAR